jgi:hypothetical protein
MERWLPFAVTGGHAGGLSDLEGAFAYDSSIPRVVRRTMRTIHPVLRLLTLATLAACGATASTPDAPTGILGPPSATIATTEGPLKLMVSDAPARLGFMFIAGTIVGGQGLVTVSSTRYGSLCAMSVTAHADVANGKITLQVKFSERLTSCVAEVRAITYVAEVSKLAPGAYDVSVVTTNTDGSTGAVLTQRVNVR